MILNIKRKLSAILVIIPLLMTLLQSNIYAAQDYPYIQGISGILMEYHTGDILYEKEMNQTIYPASTTKILTALIAIEALDLDASYTVPNNFQTVGGSKINIKIGETFTNKDLIMATLVASANDAAQLLAYQISGSVEAFADLMNQKATSLGCTNSNFVNPSGLHNANHYTTAKDMVLIAKAFIDNETLFEISKTAEYVIPATNLTSARTLRNTNRFITGDKVEGENFQIENNGILIPVVYDKVEGIKTGTTPEAKYCLVSSAQDGNLKVISAVFGSTESGVYSDSRYMLDYGLENYTRTEIINGGSVVKTIKNFIAAPESVDLVVYDSYSYVEPNTLNSNIAGEVNIDKIKLPLTKGQTVGTFTIKNFDTNTIIKELPIYASTDFESRISWTYLGKSTSGKIIRILFPLVIIISIIITSILSFRRYKQEKMRIKRKAQKSKTRM